MRRAAHPGCRPGLRTGGGRRRPSHSGSALPAPPLAAAGFLGYELSGPANNAKCTAVSQPPRPWPLACTAGLPPCAPLRPACKATRPSHAPPLRAAPSPALAQLSCVVGTASATACSETTPSYAVACSPGFQLVPPEGGKCVKVRLAGGLLLLCIRADTSARAVRLSVRCRHCLQVRPPAARIHPWPACRSHIRRLRCRAGGHGCLRRGQERLPAV